MKKQEFPDELVESLKPKQITFIEVKLMDNGEVLVTSSTDNDMIMANILATALQGLLGRLSRNAARNIQAAKLLNPVNGVNMS